MGGGELDIEALRRVTIFPECEKWYINLVIGINAEAGMDLTFITARCRGCLFAALELRVFGLKFWSFGQAALVASSTGFVSTVTYCYGPCSAIYYMTSQLSVR